MQTKSTLEGKIAFVTGGSRGMGAAIAMRLADEGAGVAFTYANGTEHAEKLIQTIESKGGRALATQADNQSSQGY